MTSQVEQYQIYNKLNRIPTENHIVNDSGIVINSDCIGIEGMQLIKDKSVDCIIADLPYGTTACKWDSVKNL